MKTIQLQGIGHVAAKAAEEFKIGETMVWNFGGKEVVTGIIKETAKFITFAIECREGSYERRLKKDRLVGVAA